MQQYSRGSSIWQFESLTSQPRGHGGMERGHNGMTSHEKCIMWVCKRMHTHTMLLSSQM
jgi:hypothetical protein